jgi:2-dehydro-3-deoxyphosphogluconate aldolase/(4S)-4-hydroxy-2-oxoglutarate aldolase
MSGSIEALLAELADTGVVPVVRTKTAEEARFAVDALYAGGMRVFELTMTTPDAIALIAELSSDSNLTIGMGTVLDGAMAEAALGAGARFLVSPALCAEAASVAVTADVPFLLGALTPSEVLAARALGAHAVKIFPASAMGGPSYLRALKDVFPDTPLVPTGGVTAETVADYLRAGAAFTGAGGQLLAREAIERRDAGALRGAAETMLAAAREGRTRG